MSLLKIVVMVQSWKLLCTQDKLQFFNSKLEELKRLASMPARNFWLDKVSRLEESFTYENTGDWQPQRRWTY